MFHDGIRSHCFKVKAQSLNDFTLFGKDLLFGKLFPCDFIAKSWKSHWVDFFLLRGNEHTNKSNQMNVFRLLSSQTSFQVLIHELNCLEKTFFWHFIWTQDFNHPVDHFSPQIFSNVVIFEKMEVPFGRIVQIPNNFKRVVTWNLVWVGHFIWFVLIFEKIVVNLR